MSSALWIGTTGLSASNKQMDVIGNNLANANTIGFKAGETSFASMLSQSLSGGSGTMQVGQGVGVAAVTTQFAQGSFETTANATDVAIDGAGFFIVKDKKEDLLYYTRAGSFYIDKNGDLSDLSGYLVQGHEIKSDGTESTEMTKINLTGRKSKPHQTEKFTIGLNLNVDTNPDSTSNSFSSSQTIYDSAGSKHTLAVTFTRTSHLDGLWTVAATVDNGQSVIPDYAWLEFDTDGSLVTDKTRHVWAGQYRVCTDSDNKNAITKDTLLNVEFNQGVNKETLAGETIKITGSKQTITYTVQNTDTVQTLLNKIKEAFTPAVPADASSDVEVELVDGRIVVINKATGSTTDECIIQKDDGTGTYVSTIFGSFNHENPYGQLGATDVQKRDVNFDFSAQNKSIGNVGWIKWDRTSSNAPEITSYAIDSRVNYVENDGYPAGLLSSIDVSKNGIITGFFTNGQQQSLGRILTASFTNNGGLNKVGSYFMETAESGSATVGNPSEGGLGGLQSHALEISNTDVAKEFIKMIAAQRAYQSSSRIITSADEMLQELMNIKR